MKMFMVMRMRGREYPENQVALVPYNWIAQYERNADRNHGQTIERLNERGGLSPLEMFAVVSGLKFREASYQMTEAGAIEWLKRRPWECQHENLTAGPLYPLRYGSHQTQVCQCGAWRTRDHRGGNVSLFRWDDIKEACKEDEEA